MTQYAERLEHYAGKAPENWFNFYDFWAVPEGDSQGDAAGARDSGAPNAGDGTP